MKMTLNQQNKSTIIISDPKNIKNELLNKIVALLVPEMHLLVLRIGAILNIAIYGHSGGRLSRRSSEIEIVWYKLHLCQIWCFWVILNQTVNFFPLGPQLFRICKTFRW